MPKVKLDLESDLTDVYTAFAKGDELINQASVGVKSFGKDAKAAYSAATTEADKFGKEVKDGAKQVDGLSKSTELVGKSTNRLKELRAEIKAITGEAIKLKQQGDITGSNDAIKKVGHLKDELKDIQDAIKSVSGNLKENFTNAIGKATSLGAQGFEAVASAQGIVGVKNEDIEKQLLKLQSIQSLARIASEFGDIGDRLTEIKIGFAPVTKAFTDFYTKGNDGLKNLAKNGIGSLSGLGSGFKSFFSSIGSGFVSFFKSAISGAKSLFAVLAANPFAIVLIVITAIIGTMVALKDKIKPIAVLFDAVGDAISYVGDKLEEVGQFFSIVASEAEKANQKIIDGTKEQLEAIKGRYDFEIAAVEAAGLKSSKVEKDKQKAVLDRIAQTIVALKLKQLTEGELEKEDLEQLKELEGERLKVIREGIVADIKERTEAKKEQDELDKKAAEEAKKRADELKRLRKDLSDFLLDLAKKSNAAEIELLTGEEKIFAQRKAAQDEIDLLRDTLVKKQQLAGKGNKINADQQAEFANLELLANQQQADALVKLQKERADKLSAEHKKEINDEATFLDTKTKLAIAQVEGLKNTTKLSEVDFEKTKQRQILQIQIDAAAESLRIKKEQLKNDENLTKQNLDEETKLLEQETANQVDKLKKQLSDLDKDKPKGFSLAKLLGLDDATFGFIEQQFQSLIGSLQELNANYFQGAQDRLDQELKANDEREKARDETLSNLQSRLQEETDLQKQGLANNVDNIREQIAAEEAAKQAAIARAKQLQEEKKKLAKEQLIVDTALQASQLILAIANLFAEGSKFWIGPVPVGLIVAGIAATAMTAAFVSGKAKAFQAVNAGGAGFKKGGYTGGSSADEERGPVHGMEFVHTADKTKQHRNLFEGIHKDDKLLMQKGILELIQGKGIVLEPDLPFNLANKKDNLRVLTHNSSFINTNKGMEKRMDELNLKVSELTKKLSDKTTVLPNGNIIKQNGNITRTIRKG